MDENATSAWQEDFWTGASYEFVWGAANGRSGIVAKFERSSSSRPGVLRFRDEGAAPAAGDYVVLRKDVPGNGTAGWWPRSCCGGSVQTESTDLSPESPGAQAVRISSSSSGAQAAVASYFDSLPGRSFVRLQGAYNLLFRAKSLGGERLLTVDIGRASRTEGSRYLARTLAVAPVWKRYSLGFDANQGAADAGTAHVSFTATHSDILLDDVSLIPVRLGAGKKTAFRDEVVKALLQLRPGLLRYWGGQLGDTLENQLAPEFARRRAGYSAWQTQEDSIRYGLHDFLELCRVVAAEPYYVVPTTFSQQEMSDLIEYLAGSPHTHYGAVRASLGQSDPWTTVFPRVHLEFGNEAWNASFRGATLENSTAYGERASALFAVAKRRAGDAASHLDLIVGGQAVNWERNREILAASRGFDSFAVAPYQMNAIDAAGTQAELFGPMLAEPQAITAPTGFMGRNRALLPAGKQLTVYEVNVSTTGGAISQSDLDRLIPSLGSGLAVIENMLLTMRDLRVKNQMFWSLPQYMLKRSDGKSVKLFGAVVDMGVTNQKRPVFLAMQLANEAIAGELVDVRQGGGNPAWTQQALNGVPRTAAHFIESFAFRDGERRSLILLNLDLAEAHG